MATSSVGYSQLTSLSSVKTLDDVSGGIPTGAQAALIQAQDQDVRWRDDGTAPSATVGMLLVANDSMYYDMPLSGLKFIETTASAKLNITFYGTR